MFCSDARLRAWVSLTSLASLCAVLTLTNAFTTRSSDSRAQLKAQVEPGTVQERLLQEALLIYNNDPSMLQTSLIPCGIPPTTLEMLRLRSALPTSQQDLDAGVAKTLHKFRKTVLGLDKYRINNPGLVADKYREVATACLVADSQSWQLALAAFEYAGLVFDKYVCACEDWGEIRVSHMWKDAAVNLLDIPLRLEGSTHGDTNTNPNPNTFDQKYFTQIEQTRESMLKVQDMMASITRLLLRHGLLRLRPVWTQEKPIRVIVAQQSESDGSDTWFVPLGATSILMGKEFDGQLRFYEKSFGYEIYPSCVEKIASMLI